MTNWPPLAVTVIGMWGLHQSRQLAYLLSTHADRHVVDISVTVCLFFCLSAGILVTDILGTGWRRAMKFCSLVDLGVRQVISLSGELWPRG